MNRMCIFLSLLILSSCQSRSSSTSRADTNSVYIYDHETFTHRNRGRGEEGVYVMHHPNYATHRYYQPIYPVKIETYENTVPDFQNFMAQHGYDSTYRPLIGIVTERQEDILDVTELLARIQINIQNPQLMNLMTNEVLTKVLAYRNLQVGQKLPIPVNTNASHSKLILYKVDKVFDLEAGMPAFGLVPVRKKAPPILLFRGTDVSLTLKGAASILADLDLSGPGLTVFHIAQEELHNWLYDVSISHEKARIMGYSLGGSFVQYTCIYERELVCTNPLFPSVAFNEPGISEDLAYQWHQLPQEQKPPLIGYITEGDLVSTVGKLIGDVYELSLDHLLEPLFAHVTLMSMQQRLYTYAIDVTLKQELDYSVQQQKLKKSSHILSPKRQRV